ncbi:hypothetical protein [Marinomonas ostreistagni]|uniref:Uncharacterized protein n=1 Tax=Marinomonas ostreistagni TaxID=359209 RepID=A0ABS0ZG88_9GAMM|nr:hypothetical protein [Marinomonas ostreistagni]MBJ7552692.1 hypothetical protein [Marinomonas ostreistagni]
MNDIISSLKENINVRLKNPLLGAFVFAWVFLHIKGFGIFLLVDTQEKIAMLRKKDWLFFDDALLPFLLSILFLILLPLANLLYDKFEGGWLVPKRLNILRAKNIAEVRAEKNYVKEFEYENLSALVNSKRELEFSAAELADIVDEIKNNCTMADQERVMQLLATTHKIINAVTELSSSAKNLEK